MNLKDFFQRHADVVGVRIEATRGSSPREAGAEMFVAHTKTYGTIGGGQLEYMAIDEARALLARGGRTGEMDVPLGPEIGQCCGGRVLLQLAFLDEAGRAAALAAEAAAARTRPPVLIFGAGHVGRALARALAQLPLAVTVIDSRRTELDSVEHGRKLLTPLPESEIKQASAGVVYAIATHDHALDFLLAAEALNRGDAAYVGMIGSATKRARFESWARSEGIDPAGLICPMGAAGLGDKRPEVIAAFIAAELLAAIAARKDILEGMESRS